MNNTELLFSSILVVVLSLICMCLSQGCAVNHHYQENCAHAAVNRALIAGGETRVWQGMGRLRDGWTYAHKESQKKVNGKWLWLYDHWNGGVTARVECPRGFEPIFPFETERFIELRFFTEFD